MNALTNFIKIARRDGVKETWKKLQYNYVLLETPEQQIKKELYGYCGMLGAIILVLSVFAYRRQWFLLPLFAFIFWVNYCQAKGKYKQLLTLKSIKEKFEEGGEM